MLRGRLIPVRAEARRLQIATITADLVGQIRIGSKYFLPLSMSAPHDVDQVLALAEVGNGEVTTRGGTAAGDRQRGEAVR